MQNSIFQNSRQQYDVWKQCKLLIKSKKNARNESFKIPRCKTRGRKELNLSLATCFGSQHSEGGRTRTRALAPPRRGLHRAAQTQRGRSGIWTSVGGRAFMARRWWPLGHVRLPGFKEKALGHPKKRVWVTTTTPPPTHTKKTSLPPQMAGYHAPTVW